MQTERAGINIIEEQRRVMLKSYLDLARVSTGDDQDPEALLNLLASDAALIDRRFAKSLLGSSERQDDQDVDQRYEYSGLIYVPGERQVYVGGAEEPTDLTPLEGAALGLMIRKPGRTVNYRQFEQSGLQRFLLKTHISHLRDKIGDESLGLSRGFRYIQPVATLGYKLQARG